jgi:hypothetical protein
MKLSVLNVVVGGYGKMVSDIPLAEKCSGICVETVGIGFHARKALQFANSPLFWLFALEDLEFLTCIMGVIIF